MVDVARTPQEWLAEVALDPDRKILFVEGTRDVGFWRTLVPEKARRRSVIYPARLLEVPSCTGGERGRALAAAVQMTQASEQVRFFLDADLDRLLGRQSGHPKNVILTDGRDLETYALNEECFSRVLNNRPCKETSRSLQNSVEQICRPIGLLRLVSEMDGLNLPFQRTLSGRVKRYITGGATASLNTTKLVGALLQNASMSTRQVHSVLARLSEEERKRNSVSTGEIAHGKDVTAVLGCFLDVEPSLVETLLFLAVRREDLEVGLAARTVIDWLEC